MKTEKLNKKTKQNRKMSKENQSTLQKSEHCLWARHCTQCGGCGEGQGRDLVLKEVTVDTGHHGNTQYIVIWAVTNV